VAWWLKRGRKFKIIPPIKKINEYALAWSSWWKGMQPEGRTSDADVWPLPRMDSTTVDWSSVARTGPTGVFLVIVALAWWGYYLRGAGQMEEFLVAVEDVLWALTQIASLPPPSLPLMAPDSISSKSTQNTKPKGKRDLDAENTDEQKNKR
jgi:hypothetical protein